MNNVLKTNTEETVRELTSVELDEVAGGNPFSSSFFGKTINSGSFAIGAVSGDFSDFRFSSNAGQVNTFGTNVA